MTPCRNGHTFASLLTVKEFTFSADPQAGHADGRSMYGIGDFGAIRPNCHHIMTYDVRGWPKPMGIRRTTTSPAVG